MWAAFDVPAVLCRQVRALTVLFRSRYMINVVRRSSPEPIAIYDPAMIPFIQRTGRRRK